MDGLVQERCNSIANALELRLSCTNPSKLYREQLRISDSATNEATGFSRTKYPGWYTSVSISISKLFFKV